MTDHRAALAAEIGKHPIIKTGDMGTDLIATTCLCGEQLTNSYAGGAPNEVAEWHAAHVADMLLASDAMAQIKADAWDEGFKERHSGGRWDETDSAYMVYGPNPYRADRLTGGT